jgi:MFS family permease
VSRDLLLVALSLMTWGMGEGMFMYFQPLYLQQLGADPLSIGAILGALGIAMTVAHIPAGYLADRIGRRPLMWASWVMGLAAASIMALATHLSVFVMGLLLYGVTAFVMSPLNSYITAARGKWSVGRALTLISSFYNLGAVLGPSIGGAIGDRIGLHQVYLISAGIFAVSTLIILGIRPQPVESGVTASSGTTHAGHPGLKITPGFALYLGIIFLALFATYLPQPLSSNYLQNQHQLSIGQIGQLGSIASLGIVVLNLTLGRLEARRGFLLAQVAVGLFTLFLWRGTSMAWFALGYCFLGGYRTARSLAAAQTRDMVHQSNMGLAYGITETIGSSAIILAPPLAGIIYNLNPAAIYIISLVLIAASLAVGIRFAAPKRETVPSPVEQALP